MLLSRTPAAWALSDTACSPRAEVGTAGATELPLVVESKVEHNAWPCDKPSAAEAQRAIASSPQLLVDAAPLHAVLCCLAVKSKLAVIVFAEAVHSTIEEYASNSARCPDDTAEQCG